MAPLTLAQRNVYADENADFNPTDEHAYISADNTRVVTSAFNLSPSKRPRKGRVYESDPRLQDWVPVPDATMDEVDALATSVSSFDVDLDEVVTKRKRYESDDPMEVWKSVSGLFLDEIVMTRWFGSANPRFFDADNVGCKSSAKVASKNSTNGHLCILFRSGLGASGQRFRSTTVEWRAGGRSGLGAMYQLGHSGATCPFPGNRRSMVVIDVNGIFVVDIQYCDCHNTNGSDMLQQLLRNGWYPATTINPATCATFNVLELFRLLRTIGNLNVHDFMRTLERSGDPTLTCDTPDRYKAFGRMARQFDFLKRMKRAGRAYEADGMATTPPGGLAVLCWACPAEGRNLPEGWRNVKPSQRYLYRLILSIDANFRLKNRLRPNEHQDLSLGSGLGYFVESSSYKDHLRSYVKEKDVSSCVAFAALLQKETRLTTGLRVSGVAGCVCARHGLVRARGLGDLQKGERYANVDWIVACTLWTERLMEYGFAYDIALPMDDKFLQTAGQNSRGVGRIQPRLLPISTTWRAHLALAYLLGMGKTDGEAMERIWASLNPASWATKEMGEGGRHDVLEDKVDHLNFEKNLGLGRALSRKLIVAISERRRQGNEFAEFDQSINKVKRKQWRTLMDNWYKDTTQPNPFVLQGGNAAGPTEREIVQDLKKEELEEVRAGRIPVLEGKMTVVAFIKAGLQLQNLQRRIRAALKNKSLTADRASQIQELRLSLVKQTQAFQKLQLTYMPGVEGLRQADDTKRNPDQPTPPPEDTKLYLPSDLTHTERLQACVQRVVDTEVNLRRGQCTDALVALRAKLFAQTHMIWFRDRNLVGQKARTRSVTLMGRLEEGITRIVAKYRSAQEAIVKLKGPAFAPEFQKLEDADVNCRVVEENDIEAAQRLRGADGSRGRNRKRSQEMHDGMCEGFSFKSLLTGLVNSCSCGVVKSQGSSRWNEEEVELIREEMKRVLRSLRFAQNEWAARATSARLFVDPEVANGLRAYALRQVELHKRIAEGFYTEWRKSVSDAVKEVMAQDGALYRHLLDGDSEVGGMAELESNNL
ncbi:CxC2 domain-containing protein [Mycena indigotica]|uniref:CxC2 domain-containing protein n=1 Tax=Mycena indigotica TaxID=2126181 RepID=A0A8H6SC97_9AGAR|nr:CxC2 domain-containing protein [Mycena indigotica]KAF7296764.1 CxC2 domain-containing protein [Mycena indigotica]